MFSAIEYFCCLCVVTHQWVDTVLKQNYCFGENENLPASVCDVFVDALSLFFRSPLKCRCLLSRKREESNIAL